MAAALKAACRFLADVFLSESQIDLFEIMSSLFRSSLRHDDAGCFFTLCQFLLHDLFIPLGNERFLIGDDLSVQVGIHHLGSFISFPDGCNGDIGAFVGGVTDGEYAFQIGPESKLIRCDDPLAVKLQLLESCRIQFLSDRRNDGIHIQDLKLAFYRHRTAPPGSIRLTQFHDLQFDLFHFSVFRNDLGRIGQELEGNAFLNGVVDLFLIRRHLISGPPIDDIDIFRSQTDSCSAGIHGCIAASYDGHLFADVDGAGKSPLRIVGLHCQSYIPQEIDTAQDAFRVFTRASHRRTLPGTYRNHDCIIVFSQRLQ